MNIFVLDTNPGLCATYHCDKHVVKMILEYTQILLMSYYRFNGLTTKDLGSNTPLVTEIFKDFPRRNTDGSPNPYKISHMNHPCTIWASKSKKNFEWLLALLGYLHSEYYLRYKSKNLDAAVLDQNLTHACYPIYMWITKTYSNLKFESEAVTQFALAMPDYIINKYSDPVEAYRMYYILEKSVFAKWSSPRRVPEWYLKENINA